MLQFLLTQISKVKAAISAINSKIATQTVTPTRNTTNTSKGTIDCVVIAGIAILTIYATAFSTTGDALEVATGCPKAKQYSSCIANGGNLTRTQQLSSQGNYFYIDPNGTTLKAGIGTNYSNQDHYAVLVYPVAD